jgi:hypothetical protein
MFENGGFCLVCLQTCPDGTFRCDQHWRSLSSPYSVDNVLIDLAREKQADTFRAILEHGFKSGMNAVLREVHEKDPKAAEQLVEILRQKRLIL